MARPQTSSTPTLLLRLRADLRGDPRKRMALIVLLPVLLLVWIPVLRGSTAAKPAVVLPVEQEQALDPEDPGLSARVDPELRARLELLVEGLDRPYVPSWSGADGDQPFASMGPASRGPTNVLRDPFREAELERELAASLQPTCTFLSQTYGNVTVIDGLPYREGDQVEHFVVRDIGARAVILEGRHGQYELHIPLQNEDQP